MENIFFLFSKSFEREKLLEMFRNNFKNVPLLFLLFICWFCVYIIISHKLKTAKMHLVKYKTYFVYVYRARIHYYYTKWTKCYDFDVDGWKWKNVICGRIDFFFPSFRINLITTKYKHVQRAGVDMKAVLFAWQIKWLFVILSGLDWANSYVNPFPYFINLNCYYLMPETMLWLERWHLKLLCIIGIWK